MASLLRNITRFLRTPQGRRMISQATRKAQEVAKDPATRAKLERARRGARRSR